MHEGIYLISSRDWLLHDELYLNTAGAELFKGPDR